jgi:hypothetical protein
MRAWWYRHHVDEEDSTMDIEEFYEGDPRRQASDEVEFGRDWYEGDMRFEVAWIADTGEVFAMAEPVSRKGISTESVTVEVLGVIDGRDAVDERLAGWQDAMRQSEGLAWVRAHVGGAAS